MKYEEYQKLKVGDIVISKDAWGQWQPEFVIENRKLTSYDGVLTYRIGETIIKTIGFNNKERYPYGWEMEKLTPHAKEILKQRRDELLKQVVFLESVLYAKKYKKTKKVKSGKI